VSSDVNLAFDVARIEFDSAGTLERRDTGAVEKGPVDFLLPKRTESRLRK
jgi:hypothetical protein